jgi:2-polyprenyl-6-hydroxyphenyl methylase/3-demethylubiquinone-9 3-methyltransferase
VSARDPSGPGAPGFAFGKNWSRFLRVLNEERICEAQDSLTSMLEVDSLAGRTFLDIGSGSGLFSLAARRLGARVHSFDSDPESVACTQELKRRYFPGEGAWTIQRASVLDEPCMRSLGEFDVVYAWGVLHHTGALWPALGNATRAVAPGGRLFISIYNDQGVQSRAWMRVKRIYNVLPRFLRVPYAAAVTLPRELLAFTAWLAMLKPGVYIRTWTTYQRSRGMSRWHDLIDWVGGYPFEVAKPEEVLEFCRRRGFNLLRLKTCGGGLGCNEYVFERVLAPLPGAGEAA